MQTEKFNWIDENIDISSFRHKIKCIEDLIELAEQADREKDWVCYDVYCDNIEIQSKELFAEDVLSYHEWKKLCRKYRMSP